MHVGVLSLLLIPALLHAQEATLTGTVRGQTGTPVAGARVTFSPEEAAGETDARGRFRLRVPAETSGSLTVAAVGFSPEEVAVLQRASQRYRRRRGSHDD